MRRLAKSDYELLQDEMRQLKRENAALRAISIEAMISNTAFRMKELERENTALRADKERLDWIARNRRISATERPWSVTPESLRESIDAAMKEAQP